MNNKQFSQLDTQEQAFLLWCAGFSTIDIAAQVGMQAYYIERWIQSPNLRWNERRLEYLKNEGYNRRIREINSVLSRTEDSLIVIDEAIGNYAKNLRAGKITVNTSEAVKLMTVQEKLYRLRMDVIREGIQAHKNNDVASVNSEQTQKTLRDIRDSIYQLAEPKDLPEGHEEEL